MMFCRKFSRSMALLAFFSVSLILFISVTSNSAYKIDADSNLAESRNINKGTTDNQVSEIELLKADSSAEQPKREVRYSSQPGHKRDPQVALDSYETAYTAQTAKHSQDINPLELQVNEPNNYATYGDVAPTSFNLPAALASTPRQTPASDYTSHPNYMYHGFMPSSASASGYSSQSTNYHYPQYRNAQPLGYPSNHQEQHSSLYDGSYFTDSSTHHWPSSPSTSGGLLSSASSALSSWTSGFSLAEIICSLIAISIGAIILGAPFFLIYLALVGNFSGMGSLSLTNPNTVSAPAGGATATGSSRRKRSALFEQLASSLSSDQNTSDFGSLSETILSQLSPLIDLNQVSGTLKRLSESIEKFSEMKPEEKPKKV